VVDLIYVQHEACESGLPLMQDGRITTVRLDGAADATTAWTVQIQSPSCGEWCLSGVNEQVLWISCKNWLQQFLLVNPYGRLPGLEKERVACSGKTESLGGIECGRTVTVVICTSEDDMIRKTLLKDR
jgi:hypothetical protein